MGVSGGGEPSDCNARSLVCQVSFATRAHEMYESRLAFDELAAKIALAVFLVHSRSPFKVGRFLAG